MTKFLFLFALIFMGSAGPGLATEPVTQIINDEKRTVVRLSAGEWKPFLSQKSNEHGFAAAVITAAFQAVGWEVEWGFYPWSRAFILAKRGEWDGSGVWIKTKERSVDFVFSETVIEDQEYIYSPVSKPLKWEKIEDLFGKSLSLTQHTKYPPIEEEIEQGLITAYRVGGYDDLLPRLVKQRTDGAVMPKMVADFFLRQNTIVASQIYWHDTVLVDKKYCLMISRKVPDHLYVRDQFNKGLALIKSNGRYQILMDRFEDGAFDPFHSGI